MTMPGCICVPMHAALGHRYISRLYLPLVIIAIILATQLLMQSLKLLLVLLLLSQHLCMPLLLLLPDGNLFPQPVFNLLLWPCLGWPSRCCCPCFTLWSP